MKIGIDLRALQTGHKFRGIGEVAKQTTNRILQLAKNDKKHEISFVFYEFDDDDPKKLLSIPKGVEYEVFKLGVMPENNAIATRFQKIQRHLRDLYGSPIEGSAKSDIFLQFDYAFGVPKDTKTLLIKHDLIPIVFWDKYFESAMRHFKNKAARTTLRTLFYNYRFMRILRRSLKNAYAIVTVSESTKRDLITYFRTPADKITTALLGVDIKPAKTTDVDTATLLPSKPYLLFVGAGDARRRVDDAVAAFNSLKADGRDIQLVLVGENFKQPSMIPNKVVRDAVIGSSYKDDILTLGYVDDATKQSLYHNAVAFVYPTKYEGFGIPVLESMLLGCPIITYKNSSIPEVGGDCAIYANDWLDMKARAAELLDQTPASRKKMTDAAKKHAEQFTWDKTAQAIYGELVSK